MDEFGQKPNQDAQSPTSNELSVTSQAPSPIPPLTPSSFDRSNRAPSPPPFAHYAQTDNTQPTPQPMQHMGTLQQSSKEQQMVEDEPSGGCCKCVIM